MEEIHNLKRQIEELNANLKTVIENNEIAQKEGEVFDDNQMDTLNFLKNWQKRTELELESIKAFLLKQ